MDRIILAAECTALPDDLMAFLSQADEMAQRIFDSAQELDTFI